ncbi:MAG: SDR family oxidoreductase [Bacteroidota bacterium]
MHILLTGVTGYIGKRLLPVFLEAGHRLTVSVRDGERFQNPAPERITVWEIDFLNPMKLDRVPREIDVAYYLIHSMADRRSEFMERESLCATNFRLAMEHVGVGQVIYLSGIAHEKELSPHLLSRKKVETILMDGKFHTTVLRAGIIVGSGSASFELIRDLVEKLPIMITPKWVRTRSQPIAIRDVIQCLEKIAGAEEYFDRAVDIGGPDVLTYREMMLEFGRARGLKRAIVTVPIMTPRLSSYWLYFMTSVSYNLAVNLVDSMKVEVLPQQNATQEILGRPPMPYVEAVNLAFKRIRQQMVVSSWKDAMTDEDLKDGKIDEFLSVPSFGCLKDIRERSFPRNQREAIVSRVFSIGGERGWYYGTWLWKIRGWMDKMVGGIGLRRGRRHPDELYPGDALDFWRVLHADRASGRLLLYAEMKLPGEAWLEFRMKEENAGQVRIVQTATFRPRGLFGRMYWYCVLPLHFFVFRGMLRKITQVPEVTPNPPLAT